MLSGGGDTSAGFDIVPSMETCNRKQNALLAVGGNAFLGGGEDRIRTCDRGFRPGNRLAGGPIRPLWHLPDLCLKVSGLHVDMSITQPETCGHANLQLLAEGVGFEPTLV